MRVYFVFIDNLRFAQNRQIDFRAPRNVIHQAPKI